MKKFLVILMSAFFIAGLFSVVIPTGADAVPSYARQTDQPCLNCHFQHIPKLNAMGRAFKLGGMTDTALDTIEDMIVPSTVSLVTKFRYRQYEARTGSINDTNPELGEFRGNWEFPDEMAAWFAGRLSEHWGAAIEFPGPAVSGKFLYHNSFGENVTWGLSLWFTDALGPFFGQELWNTGVVRNHRSFENRTRTSAAQATGVGANEATGLTLYAGTDMWYASVGMWQPTAAAGIDTNFDMSVLYRVAFTPTWNNWDLMFGLYGTGGDAKADFAGTGTTLQTIDTQAIGVDFQAQGAFGDASVEVQANFLLDTGNNVNALYTVDDRAYGGNIEVGFMGDVVGLAAGALSHNPKGPGNEETSFTIGGWWNMSQNVSIQPAVTFIDGDGRLNETEFILLMLNAF